MPKLEESHIGSIHWSASDGNGSKVLSQGQKELRYNDVEINRKNGLIIKRIALSDHFGFSLADGGDQQDDGHGFGLSGDRDDEPTIGWDWFEVDRLRHAVKLQESGELLFNTKQTANGTEIVHMEFLTDVSIRINLTTEEPASEPKWRIKIFRGSVIDWPPGE